MREKREENRHLPAIWSKQPLRSHLQPPQPQCRFSGGSGRQLRALSACRSRAAREGAIDFKGWVTSKSHSKRRLSLHFKNINWRPWRSHDGGSDPLGGPGVHQIDHFLRCLGGLARMGCFSLRGFTGWLQAAASARSAGGLAATGARPPVAGPGGFRSNGGLSEVVPYPSLACWQLAVVFTKLSPPSTTVTMAALFRYNVDERKIEKMSERAVFSSCRTAIKFTRKSHTSRLIKK